MTEYCDLTGKRTRMSRLSHWLTLSAREPQAAFAASRIAKPKGCFSKRFFFQKETRQGQCVGKMGAGNLERDRLLFCLHTGEGNLLGIEKCLSHQYLLYHLHAYPLARTRLFIF